MSDRDDGLQQVIDLLKQPVRLDSSFDAKVMEQVESVPPPRTWARSLWTVADWMRGRPRLGSLLAEPHTPVRTRQSQIPRNLTPAQDPRELLGWSHPECVCDSQHPR